MTQKVIQAQSAISVVEKEAVTLNCVYEVSSYNYYLFWYKQPSSGKMTFLMHQESYNEQNTTEGRYSLNFQKSASSINLTITDSQLGDSAVYFCALRDATVMWVPVRAPQNHQHEIEALGRDSITYRMKQVGGWQGNLSSIHIECVDITSIKSKGISCALE